MIVVVFVWTNIPILWAGFITIYFENDQFYHIMHILLIWIFLAFHESQIFISLDILFVIFAFLWSTLWISCKFLEQSIMYTPYIFSRFNIWFLYYIIILTNFVYEQYLIKLNNFWSRFYVIDYKYKYLLPGSMLFCSKLKNCIILQAAD